MFQSVCITRVYKPCIVEDSHILNAARAERRYRAAAMFGDRGRLAVASCMLAACNTVDNPNVPSPAAKLDETVFKCNVEPVLARQCSYNACHGLERANNVQSALRVYTPGKLRATPPANIDAMTAKLTADEEHANFVSAAGFAFDVASVEDNMLLRKPLPSGAGGFEHKGGVIYSGGTGDPQYMAIKAWLSGTGACK